MSITLSAAAQKIFDTEVKQAFQGMGKLREAVTLRTNVKGSTYRFNSLGKGLANQKSVHEDVTPMNVAHSNQTATLEKWYAPEYTDFFSNEEAPFDERVELVQAVSGALSRRMDQLVLDKISDSVIGYSANAAGVVDTNVGGASSGLNVEKLIEAAKLLDDQGVPAEERYFIGSTKSKADLLNTTKATSSDFNTVQALVRGQIDTFLGFKFIWIESRTEGGLPKSGSIRENYAIHKSAVGLCIGNDITAKATFVDVKDAWLVNGKMRAGSVARDPKGMVLVQTTEA